MLSLTLGSISAGLWSPVFYSFQGTSVNSFVAGQNGTFISARAVVIRLIFGGTFGFSFVYLNIRLSSQHN